MCCCFTARLLLEFVVALLICQRWRTGVLVFALTATTNITKYVRCCYIVIGLFSVIFYFLLFVVGCFCCCLFIFYFCWCPKHLVVVVLVSHCHCSILAAVVCHCYCSIVDIVSHCYCSIVVIEETVSRLLAC